jgi:hypothetical protein
VQDVLQAAKELQESEAKRKEEKRPTFERLLTAANGASMPHMEAGTP